MARYLIIAFFVITTALAQDTNRFLVPYRAGNYWGYSDTLANVKIKPVYDKVDAKSTTSEGSENQYLVHKGGKAGIINAVGIVVPVEFDSIYIRGVDYKNHLFLVENAGLWGMYSMQGDLRIPLLYDVIEKTYSERDGTPGGKTFLVQKGRECLIVDDFNTVLLRGLNSASELYHDGIKVKKGNKYALYNIRDRKTVTGFDYDSLAVISIDKYRNTMPAKIFFAAAGKKMYLLDIDGSRQEIDKMPEIDKYSGQGYAEEFIDVSHPHLQKETEVTAARVAAMIGDTEIKKKDNYKYQVSGLSLKRVNGYFIKDPDKNLIGIVNSTGNYVIPPVYDKLILFDNPDYLLLYKDNKAGLYNINTRAIQLEPAYDAIHIQSNMFVLVTKNKTGIFFDGGRGLVKGAKYTVYIAPEYDSYLGEETTSNRSPRAWFKMYKFSNNGKICYVGSNGVKFFED